MFLIKMKMHFSILLVLCVVIHSNSQDPELDEEAAAKKEVLAIVKNSASSVINFLGPSGEPQEDVPRPTIMTMLKSAPSATYNFLTDRLRPVGQRIVEELPATWVEIASEKAAIASTYFPFISPYPIRTRMRMYKDLTKSLGGFAYKKIPLIDHTSPEEREKKAQRVLDIFTKALSTFYDLPVPPKFTRVSLKTIMQTLPNGPKQTNVMGSACYLCIIAKILEIKMDVIVNGEVQMKTVLDNFEVYTSTLVQMFKFANDQTRRSLFPSIYLLYKELIRYERMSNIRIRVTYDNALKSAFANVINKIETYMEKTLELYLNYTFFQGVYSYINTILEENDSAQMPTDLKKFLNICPLLFRMFIDDKYVLEDFMTRLKTSESEVLSKEIYPDVIRFSLNYPFINHNVLYTPVYSASSGNMGIYYENYVPTRNDMSSVMIGHFRNVLCTFSDFLEVITSVTSLKGKGLTEKEYLELIFQEFVELNEWNRAFTTYGSHINGLKPEGQMEQHVAAFANLTFRFKSYLRYFITEFNDFDKIINDSVLRYNMSTIFDSYQNIYMKHIFLPNQKFVEKSEEYIKFNYDFKEHCKPFPAVSINFQTFTETDGTNLKFTIQDKINNISLRRLSSQYFLQNSLQFSDFVKDTKIFAVNCSQTSLLDVVCPNISYFV